MVVAAAGPVVTDPMVPVFLGATGHTNNTGELTDRSNRTKGCFGRSIHQDTAVEEAVLLRPDSELAMGWTIGDLTANTNAELVATARKVYGQLMRQRNGRVYWKHVKGHSGHIRNDHADHLATMGLR